MLEEEIYRIIILSFNKSIEQVFIIINEYLIDKSFKLNNYKMIEIFIH